MKKVKQILKSIWQDYFVFPWYIINHPIDGFYEMKRYKRGLLRVSTVYIILESTIGILQYRYTGYLFNEFNVNNFDYIRQILITLSPYLVFIVANWAITTLMDGKGTFKDIYNVVGYALFLKVWFSIFNIFLSNVLTLNEAFFYFGIETLGYGIMLIMVFMGILVVHEYSLSKAVLTILLTFFTMGVLIFIGLLSFSLAQQIIVFIVTIYREITLRL